jgi:dCTP deaminase
MILSAAQVYALLRAGPTAEDPLVITPNPQMETGDPQGAASIDLRLGTWFVSLRHARMTHLSVDEPGAPARLAETHYVSYGAGYVLHPRGFALGATIEWLRMPRNLAAYVIGKSSWGRRGLIIATATGIHPGFTGCLTLELSNIGQIPIELKPGIKLCQLFFHNVDSLAESKFGLATADAYQSQYGGKRRPGIGRIDPDWIAQRLARSDPGEKIDSNWRVQQLAKSDPEE